jgi:hypothetical protein
MIGANRNLEVCANGVGCRLSVPRHLGTMLIFFAWVIWFWLLVRVIGDVFRRHDLSGWARPVGHCS